uniref:Uncharacterized protein n=1 Tax=Eutreptiella gymnastica TaxID=73025 RepID=A0A7S1HV22_9EUGL|mmetsp:Transcript_107623/g.185551  ORF Transcript_107623/g.185551 Transcript_107623/m.185551 type:complete len:201 (+) Transcript_107623:124-726(+)
MVKKALKKTCTHHGCDKYDQGRGYCARHGGGVRCHMLGCKNIAVGKKVCKFHGHLRCNAAGCNQRDGGSGYCKRHADEFGDAEVCNHMTPGVFCDLCSHRMEEDECAADNDSDEVCSMDTILNHNPRQVQAEPVLELQQRSTRGTAEYARRFHPVGPIAHSQAPGTGTPWPMESVDVARNRLKCMWEVAQAITKLLSCPR